MYIITIFFEIPHFIALLSSSVMLSLNSLAHREVSLKPFAKCVD